MYLRFARWALTGGVTFVIEAGTFWLGLRVLHSVWLANAVALPIAMVVNYGLHHRFSFRSDRSHGPAFSWYLVALALAYGMNSVLVQWFMNRGAHALFAKLIALPIQAPVSFLFLNYVVFHPRADRQLAA